MTMPRKGRRTIVVDGDTYYYKIRPVCDWVSDLVLIFQDPTDKIHSRTFSMSTKYAAFTPRDVEREIRKVMVNSGE